MHGANTNKGAVLSLYYLFDKRLHMNEKPAFCMYTVSYSEAHQPFLLAEHVYIIYSSFAPVCINSLIVNSLYNSEND